MNVESISHSHKIVKENLKDLSSMGGDLCGFELVLCITYFPSGASCGTKTLVLSCLKLIWIQIWHSTRLAGENQKKIIFMPSSWREMQIDRKSGRRFYFLRPKLIHYVWFEHKNRDKDEKIQHYNHRQREKS